MEMSAKMVVMSHLSDAQELIGFVCGSEASERINFAKYIILETKGNLNQDIDADAMYSKFQDMLKARKAQPETGVDKKYHFVNEYGWIDRNYPTYTYKEYKPLKHTAMILHGLFTSVWDGGTEITTASTLDTETGFLDTVQTDEDITELDCLDSEKFVDSEGNEYEVCPDCHDHVLKEKDITDTDEDGNELPEIAGVIICSDPYCESNWVQV